MDTHGANVIDDVWSLLEEAYKTFGPYPTLLERDFNIPEVPELIEEVDQIRKIQAGFEDADHSDSAALKRHG